jgi:protein-S-isoprenylcysteine O-methyltransferase Ste14
MVGGANGKKRRLPIATVISSIAGAAIGAWFANASQYQPLLAGLATSPMAIALYLWLLLSLYWGLAARKASATSSSESGGSRTFHLLLVCAAQVLTFWPFAGWPFAGATAPEFPRVLPATAVVPIIGVAVVTGGFVLAIWARRQLGRNWSGAVTTKVGHDLVRSGPYRLIRHPIYTGVIAMYVGTALITGRLQGVIAVVLIVLAYARKIGLEERTLRGAFGAAYDEYRRGSWALVPWLV